MSFIDRVLSSPADSAALDAFGRTRTSSLVTLFDGKLINGDQFQWDDQEMGGTGTSSTFLPNESSQEMAVSAATAGTRLRQTIRRFGYQAGKSQLIFISVNFEGAVAGVTKESGYYTDDDGLFFRLTGSGMSVVRRSSVTGSPVEEVVPQASWNVDPMDGTGPSGFTVDWSKVQILFIDFEWLGVGRVRMGLVIDGQIFFTHYFLHANVISSVYMKTPNLPLRYRIENDGTGAATTLKCICSTVSTEEGRQPIGGLFGLSSDPTLGNLGTGVEHALISLRLKSTHLDAIVQFTGYAAVSDSQEGRVFDLSVFFNATLADPTTWVSLPNSAIEYMLGDGNTVVTTGSEGATIASTGKSIVQITQQDTPVLGSTIDGTPTVITIAVRPITANMTAFASVNWRELP